MTELEARLEKARSVSADTDPLIHYERGACWLLVNAGVPTMLDSIRWGQKPNQWEVWAAEAILFTIDSIRQSRWREALRGWGQVREYTGRMGGFLPSPISDAVGALQNALERKIG